MTTGYTEVYTDYGLYMVDESMIDRIIYNAQYYKFQANNPIRNPTEGGLFLPTTYHFTFPHHAADIAAKVGVQTFRTAQSMKTWLREVRQQRSVEAQGREVEALREMLASIEREGYRAQERMRQLNREASKVTMTRIETSAGRYKQAAEIAKVVRNGSVTTLMVIGGVASGGTALMAGGAGSLLKGVGKWQDSGNVGAGVVEASMSFVTFLIPDPSGSTAKVVLGTIGKESVGAVGNMGIGLIEGKSLKEASLNAAIDGALGIGLDAATSKLLPADELKKLLGQLGGVALPAEVKVDIITRGLVKNATGTVKGSAADATTKMLMGKAANSNGRGVPLKPTIPLGPPIWADVAILGPDVAMPARRRAA